VNVQNGNEDQARSNTGVDCLIRAVYLSSRADLKAGSSILFNHRLKFGLQEHVGTDPTQTKTDGIYSPPSRQLYSDADTS
jgi:hypothetical protein